MIFPNGDSWLVSPVILYEKLKPFLTVRIPDVIDRDPQGGGAVRTDAPPGRKLIKVGQRHCMLAWETPPDKVDLNPYVYNWGAPSFAQFCEWYNLDPYWGIEHPDIHEVKMMRRQ
jgi:hypothetical protein